MQSIVDIIPGKASDIQIYHSPNTILNIYAGYLRTAADNRLILIRGIYTDDPRAISYGGYYYDKLKGENDNRSMKILVPALLRTKLQSQQIYVFSGFVTKQIKDSAVELNFIVDNMLTSEKSQYTESELEGFKIIKHKVAMGYVDVEAKIRDSIYENRKLRIANIYGVSLFVESDFTAGLSTSKVNFDIQNFSCSLVQPAAIVETLKKIALGNFDMVAIVRGGNDGTLEVLNDPQISKQIFNMNSAFLAALGHTGTTETLLDKIADKKFLLPHEYGTKLHQIVEKAKDELTNSRAVLLEKVRNEMTKSFTDVVKAKDEQVKLLQEQVTKANTSNLELSKHYDKVIEEKVSKVNKQNQVAIDNIRSEQKSSQIIALVIGFALAMLIIYIFKS